ncbi:nuclear transport factor 2 family protein [Umezawaea sp.]|uniref:nuclear transport factor 2 family protein n=1 Tax=Umezawaea sp. TaxID=1955258 RepID=UPI002ED5DE89
MSAPQTTDSVRTTAQRTFRTHLEHLAAGRTAEWAELFTEDGVLEFPYAPKGYPSRVVGREGLAGHLRGFSENFRVDFTDLRFHETVDPSLVIAELKGTGVALATGRPYDQTYICVVETEGGRISRYVDFWNPLVVAEALGEG